MPRKSDAHRWLYAELPPVAGDEHPRPAQRCARCGLVREAHNNHGAYYKRDASCLGWVYHPTEPPCEPRATDAPQ